MTPASEFLLVQRFLDDLRAGSAVTGLEAVAAALQRGAGRLVLVREGWAKMGRSCPACGRLSVDHRSCPWCFRATTPVLDLVSELTERAAAAGISVFRVRADRRFDAAGRIGACLRNAAVLRPARPAARSALAAAEIWKLREFGHSLGDRAAVPLGPVYL